MNNLETCYESVREKIVYLDCVEEKRKVKSTAERLSKYNYQPPFVFEAPGFVTYSQKDALQQLKKLKKLKDDTVSATGAAAGHSAEEVKVMAMEMFYKEFKLLQHLRKDIPEAWDHINELYEDD